MATNVLCVGLNAPKALTNVLLNEHTTVRQFKEKIDPEKHEQLYLCSGGVPLEDDDVVPTSAQVVVLTAHYRLYAGKGGFGSLIRATGSHMNRSSDKSACRDISGRRMRDIKNEKKVAEWMAGETQRKKEKADRKKRRLEKLLEEPHHKFEDTSYMEQIRSREEEMADSLKHGLNRDDSSPGPSKKPKLWLHSEELSSSESESELTQTTKDSIVLSTGEVTSSTASIDNTSTLAKASIDNASTLASSPDTVTPSDALVPKLTPSQDAKSDIIPDAASPEQSLDEVQIDLSAYSSAEELLSVGSDKLKSVLAKMGLKCGGTPLQRAQRLYSTKGLTPDQLPPSLFTKNKKRKQT